MSKPTDQERKWLTRQQIRFEQHIGKVKNLMKNLEQTSCYLVIDGSEYRFEVPDDMVKTVLQHEIDHTRDLLERGRKHLEE